MFEDIYKTVEKEARATFRDKASRFIGIALPVYSENQIKEELARIKKEFFDATHHCYAWRLGWDKAAYRINDDGEPSGTAGKPIYGQILSHDLTNIMIVVVRYYGGTKLGVSGLINAYKTAANEAITAATIVEKTVNEIYNLSFEPLLMNQVMKQLKEAKANVLNMDFDNQQKLEFSVRRLQAHSLTEKLMKISGVSIHFKGIEQ